MKVFLSVFVSAILFASDITASPLPTRAGQHHDLSATLSGTLRDLQNLGKAKKAVISYGSEAVGEAAAAASSAAVEYGSEVGNAALEYAADTGNAAIQYGSDASNSAYEYSANAGAEALNTVSSAGNAAIEYASSVDPIQV